MGTLRRYLGALPERDGTQLGAEASRRQSANHRHDIFSAACRLGCEGIVSKRLGSHYVSGRCEVWLKSKNPAAPAVRREAEEDWGRR